MLSDVVRRYGAWVLPFWVDMVRQLVAIPSVSSHDPILDQSNRDVVDLLAEWAETIGCTVQIHRLKGNTEKANLIATLGQGEGGLVLSGHTDTVACDADRWSQDPFTLAQQDGRLYGLGTADMKGFFAAAFHAAQRVESASLFRRPLTIVGTADEECTMNGARALAEHREWLGRYAIIGEPTGLRPVRKHKGVLHARITVTGRSGHASHPGRGLNAIEGMHRVIGALNTWRDLTGSRYRDDDFDIPYPTLSYGRIQGGDSANRICARCALDVDVRLVPSMERSVVLRELRQAVTSALAGTPWGFEVFPFKGGANPFAGSTDTAFLKMVECVCGSQATSALFATEAPYLAELGLDTVIVGAGDIAVAHQPDEYVTISAMERATDIYARLIQKVCVEVV